MDFRTAAELLAVCEANGITIAEAMLRREMSINGVDRETALADMRKAYGIMKSAVNDALTKPARSMGGLIGGEAAKMNTHRLCERPVCGTLVAKASAYAMGVLEVNASMGLIVAAPTAGSSGVIPGTFLAVQEEFGFSDDRMIEALFHASAVGYLIMRNASVSGAQGGCQAEVGSASAMAAAAIAGLMGATAPMSLSAASSAIANTLGLVCDPVAGLVEVPCQKRNAMGAANALVCAEISLSGIEELAPFDEMVEAMLKVGQRIPMELRETAQGGVAATPTACSVCTASG